MTLTYIRCAPCGCKDVKEYLIPYAPALNPTEILWRHIKYFWLPFSAYQCMEALREALEHILKDFGSKYQITFV